MFRNDSYRGNKHYAAFQCAGAGLGATIHFDKYVTILCVVGYVMRATRMFDLRFKISHSAGPTYLH